MWRTVLWAAGVFAVDFVILTFFWTATVDINVLSHSKALGAYQDHPSLAALQAVDAIRDATAKTQYEIRAIVVLIIFLFTATAFFILGKRSERRRS
ncbi:MAG: hypothetical protein ABIT38_22865 [Gemmatimonadaceae bacterium]